MWMKELAEQDLSCAEDPEPVGSHDRGKPRATMAQYVALIGEDVAANLEGIARARLEKPPRQYQSDAAVHQAYMQTVSGGGEHAGDGEPPEDAAQVEAPKTVAAYFEPLPWDITTDDELRALLDFTHRARLQPLAKELLKLPCMQPGAWDWATTVPAAHFGAEWRSSYAELSAASVPEQLALAG